MFSSTITLLVSVTLVYQPRYIQKHTETIKYFSIITLPWLFQLHSGKYFVKMSVKEFNLKT